MGRKTLRPSPLILSSLPRVLLGFAALLGASGSAGARDLLSIPDQRVTPGERDVWFPVLMMSTQPVQTVQVMVTFDPGVVRPSRIEFAFSLLGDLEPELFNFNIEDDLVELGAIFDFNLPFTGRVLAPTRRSRLVNLVLDVLPSAPLGETHVAPTNDLERSLVLNIFTVDGFSVLPELDGAVVTVVASGEGEHFVRGDADGSGRVNISDALLLLNFLFLGSDRPRCLSAADFDDTGRVTISSAVAVLNYLFLQGEPPAVPFPNPGLDPTPDRLDCGG
jgi:hypothetical protein